MATPAVLDPFIELEIRSDLERLQGTWLSVNGRRRAEFVLCDYLFAVRFADGETYLGTFRLGPESRPKTMDMRIDEGPARHRSKIARCVYELDGDTLRWCTGEPGVEERLTTFPAADDPRYLSLVLRREGT
jgi:uncharacterized protein (TIGR03067 family)